MEEAPGVIPGPFLGAGERAEGGGLRPARTGNVCAMNTLYFRHCLTGLLFGGRMWRMGA
jgi:hypothetical protein